MTKKININDFKNYGIDNEELITIVESIINKKNIYQQYSLLFDYVCNYLDYDMKSNNYCDFQNGKCIANRLDISVNKDNGCCYRVKTGLCPNLKNSVCTNRNIACKLFMCKYIEKKMIKYKLKNILPIHYFFNLKQIYIMKNNYFKPKEEVLNLLMKYRTI